ncbi:PAS domain S-box-containing protein [Oxalobacteraceae bacterium GrIS 1.11]
MKLLSHLRPDSLRSRLIGASVLVEVILLTVLISNSVRLINDAARASIHAALAQAVPMLNAAAAPYLMQRDYSGLQDFLATTVSEKERELIYVGIATPQRRWIARAGLPDGAALPALSGSVSAALDEGVYHIERPIVLAGQPLGIMRLGLSTRIVAETRSALVRQGLLIAAVEIGLSVLLLSAIGIWLTAHLQRAAAVSRAIGRGNYTLRLGEGGGAEVADLANAVNHMAAEIEQKMLALQELNAALEGRVAERTAALDMALQEQQTILDNAIVGILFVRERVILRCNRGWSELLGYPPGVLEGESTRIYYASDASHRVHGQTVYPDIVAGRAAIGEWAFQRRDGSPIWCSYQGKAIDPDDLSKGSIWVLQDITARKASECELAQRSAALQVSLARLRATQAELIQAEKLASLGQLVAGIAHELNTPIGNIVTMASSVSERIAAIAGAESAGGLTRSALQHGMQDCRGASEIMVRNATRAARLIDQFKLIASNQSHDMRCCYDLGQLVRDVAHTQAMAFEAAGVTLAIDCAAPLEMDSFPRLLGEVLSSLLSNVLDHAFDAQAGGHLAIGIRALPEQQIEITFHDNGHGIAAHVLPHVFEPFYTTRRGAGHAGLGLHILYNLVTAALGGAIRIDSAPAQGTTVTMLLPACAEAALAQDLGS